MLGADVPTCGPGRFMRGAPCGIGARAAGPGMRGAPPGIGAARGTAGVARADGSLGAAGARAGVAGIFGTPRAATGRASGAAFGTVTRGTEGVRTAGVRTAAGGRAARAVGSLGCCHHLAFFWPGNSFVDTPRFLSRALSRALPGLTPAFLSAATSAFCVQGLPLGILLELFGIALGGHATTLHAAARLALGAC